MSDDDEFLTRLFRDALANMPLPKGEPFPGETLRADGWEYRDLPRMSLEMFDKFVVIIGEENIRWLSSASGTDWKRGQMFVSPKGLENARAHTAKKRH